MVNRYEIGIVETRNVVKALLDGYGYDFRDYALTSFKRRLEDIIMDKGLRSAEGLTRQLLDNKLFFQEFLKEIIPDTTEMFRDPSLWRMLRDTILKDVSSSLTSKIWVAGFDSGEELYSLCILLKEMDLLDKVQVIASVLSNKTLEKIHKGEVDIKQLELNVANYERSSGIANYSDYYHLNQESGVLTMDVQLIQGVTFLMQDTLLNNAPGGIRLALFRNQLIYYNQVLQDKAISVVGNSLVPGGYLILGSKESLENTNTNNKFTVINGIEKVYKKKNG